MTRITKLSDLSRAVALALCDEPPLSERRAIHESGCWHWVPSTWCECNTCLFGDTAFSHDREAHWEPADFATCPLASKLLEDRMRGACWQWGFSEQTKAGRPYWWLVTLTSPASPHSDKPTRHQSRFIAMCLASLRALGVEFELPEGWDAR